MLERAKTHALPVLNRIPDVTPAAQACCGACRTCATTNILAAGTAVLVAAGLHLVSSFRRLAQR